MPDYEAWSQLLILILCCKANQENKRSNELVQAQCQKQFSWHVLTTLSFAMSHTAVRQGIRLHLYLLFFYEAPEKTYKPHVGKILLWDLSIASRLSQTLFLQIRFHILWILKQNACTAMNFSIVYQDYTLHVLSFPPTAKVHWHLPINLMLRSSGQGNALLCQIQCPDCLSHTGGWKRGTKENTTENKNKANKNKAKNFHKIKAVLKRQKWVATKSENHRD